MRLIDADKFKGKVIASHCYSGVNKLINVDDVPTAYDVGKVVERLEAEQQKYTAQALATDDIDTTFRCAIYEVAMQTAIDIVKRGGKEQ